MSKQAWHEIKISFFFYFSTTTKVKNLLLLLGFALNKNNFQKPKHLILMTAPSSIIVMRSVISYDPACPSVGRSVGRSVDRSVAFIFTIISLIQKSNYIFRAQLSLWILIVVLWKDKTMITDFEKDEK